MVASTVPDVTDRQIGTVLQFELAAVGGDVPALLERASRAIRDLGAVEVSDVVFRPARPGAPAAVSVYFVRDD